MIYLVNCVDSIVFILCADINRWLYWPFLGMQSACAQGCNGVQPSKRRSRDADVVGASDAQTRTGSRDRIPQDARELYIETLSSPARHLYCK